ncbi:MAG: DUF4395 domain-containing protein [Thiobacillus sp.]|nr:DUF4395 domain-containing protein [Thiobacillus sp.]
MLPLQTVDHAAIKTGQLLAIVTLTGAFIFNRWEPVAALAAVFLITAITWRYGPFFLVYRLILLPLKLVRPDMRHDNTQPHRFGQAVGAVSALVAAAALYSGHHTAGWALVGVLIALTGLSFMGWCIGCFIYYQLNRLGIGGFFARSPTDGGVPLGSRPRKDS